MEFRIGTMGFGYPDWSGVFYPRGMRGPDQLAFYSRYFDAVELDTTFHATPAPEVVRRWANATPDKFRFCVKAPAAVTHGARLDEQAAPMLWFLEIMRELGPKLGVVLLQFPPAFGFEQFDRLAAFLPRLPDDIRFAVEFRHDSWLRDQTTSLLRETRTAWAVGDYAQVILPVRVTADFLYIRWIGKHGTFDRHDHEREDLTPRLGEWKRQIKSAPPQVKTTWGFFNNDFAGHSIATANRMKRLMGLTVKEPAPADRGELFA